MEQKRSAIATRTFLTRRYGALRVLRLAQRRAYDAGPRSSTSPRCFRASGVWRRVMLIRRREGPGMARLFKHKDVEDYFVTFDYATKDPAELAKIVKLYEAGKVIVLENARLDLDRDFIGSVELPNEDPFKKFKSV